MTIGEYLFISFWHEKTRSSFENSDRINDVQAYWKKDGNEEKNNNQERGHLVAKWTWKVDIYAMLKIAGQGSIGMNE